jgi:hypothetical protein
VNSPAGHDRPRQRKAYSSQSGKKTDELESGDR